ncbi:hypothetical protein OAQ20_01000 [Flavobacteriaceae bacterium]|nr:hypothetical protein [Flavobacteriaceae bacterium]
MKIIFIAYSELTDKVYKEYFIDKFLINNVEVEYWNISPIVRDAHQDNGTFNYPDYKLFNSFSEFKNELKTKASDDIRFFTNFPLKIKYFKFYRLLKLNKCKTYQINNFSRPINIENKPFLKKVLFHLLNPNFISGILSERIFLKFIKKFHLVNKFNKIFAAGFIESQSYDWAKKTININSFDYEKSKGEYLKILNNRYCVFFDIYFPFHNDIKFNNIKTLNSKRYYRSLNAFFLKIEKKFKISVVICSHPTAFDNEKHFEGRPVYRMKTMELTRNAEFCLSHHSTSMSYAMIFKKPIVFIYNNEMNSLYKNYYMKDLLSLSKYTSMPLINVDSEFFDRDELIVNDDIYEKYVHDYVASKESQNKDSYQIILNNL